MQDTIEARSITEKIMDITELGTVLVSEKRPRNCATIINAAHSTVTNANLSTATSTESRMWNTLISLRSSLLKFSFSFSCIFTRIIKFFI